MYRKWRMATVILQAHIRQHQQKTRYTEVKNAAAICQVGGFCVYVAYVWCLACMMLTVTILSPDTLEISRCQENAGSPETGETGCHYNSINMEGLSGLSEDMENAPMHTIIWLFASFSCPAFTTLHTAFIPSILWSSSFLIDMHTIRWHLF
jgi:hypothetical protein